MSSPLMIDPDGDLVNRITGEPAKPTLRLSADKLSGVEWAPYILAKAKEASIAADMSLRFWDEFSRTARACLGADALPEERDAFMKVVRERFEVTEYTRGSKSNGD